MQKIQANIKTTAPDDALRIDDFSLLPVNEKPPVITSHPIRNFNQTTWTEVDSEGQLRFRDVNPILDTFVVRKGTAISWGLYCVDPSNLQNINDTSKLKFTWRRDGHELFALNSLNQGLGAAFVEYSEQECTEEIEGEYVCEVSNQYGSTNTVPFTLRILDVDNAELLYTNLILNGDGEGGLDGWTNTDGLVVTACGKEKTTIAKQNTITTFPDFFPISTGSNYLPPHSYRFTTRISENALFYRAYAESVNLNGENLLNYNISTDELVEIPGWMSTSAIKTKMPVIPNEDYGRVADLPRQGFFPGPNYIDRYNNNNTNQNRSINLSTELNAEARPLTYFTRDVIRFNQRPFTEFSQTVDISSIESVVRGEVGGIDYITAQVFAYVGIALSRCTIRATVNGTLREYNWLVHDLVTYREILGGKEVQKVRPDRGTPIEIVQHTDDTTSLHLDVLNSAGDVIKTQDIPGPESLDLWAVREKVDYALTLFPIYCFFEQNDNPIEVFGQTYTNTSALSQLYDVSLNKQIQSTDVNVSFLIKRYFDFMQAEYGQVWEYKGNITDDDPVFTQIIDNKYIGRAVKDYGCEAFFAVGAAVELPANASRLRLTVRFTNNSPSLTDQSPETKGWNTSEIYNTIFNTNTTSPVDGGDVPSTSNPYYKYGNPRCAVTKLKLQLIPNTDIASQKHTTYALPPKSSTVWGIARDLALRPVNDATKKDIFKYTLIQPQEALPPRIVVTSLQQDEINNINRQITEESGEATRPFNLPTNVSPQALEEDRAFERDSIEVEEGNRLVGDADNLTSNDIP